MKALTSLSQLANYIKEQEKEKRRLKKILSQKEVTIQSLNDQLKRTSDELLEIRHTYFLYR